jgi:hypothetical protein
VLWFRFDDLCVYAFKLHSRFDAWRRCIGCRGGGRGKR